MEYLAAHLSKIHGLDWHPDNEYTLATSSQDNSVRVSVASGPPAWERSEWWSRSSSAAAEVLEESSPMAGSGSLALLSQGCVYKRGREVTVGWVGGCLPPFCGAVGSTEAENSHFCLLLARRQLATFQRSLHPKTQRCQLQADYSNLQGGALELLELPSSCQIRLSIRGCLQVLPGRASSLGGGSLLCMSARWSSFTFS